MEKLNEIEEKIRKERRLAQRYLDIARVMIVALNTKGEVTLINRKGCEVLGYKEEEIIGKNWFYNYLPERLRDKVKKVSEKLLSGEMKLVEHFENPVLTKSGEERMVAWRKTIVDDDSGNITGTLSSGHDITERKLGREEKKVFEAGIENANDGIAFTKLNGDMLYFNQAACKIFGYNPDEMKKINISKFSATSGDSKKLEESVREKGGFSGDIMGVRKNGETFPAILSVSIVDDEKGKPIGRMGVFRDISERTHMEEAIKESEERYRGLSQAAFEAIFISEKGVCLEQNSTAEKMFGYTLSEAIGRLGTEWIIPEDREMVMNNMLSGYEEPYEATALRKDGSTFPAEIRGKMMHYKGRTVRVTALSDITLRKKAEEQLHNALVEIERLNERLEQENIYLREVIKVEHKFEEIIGQSKSLKRTLNKVEQVAPTDTNVLVLGETGTGKEMIARSIHKLSSRREQPLVKVNCAALPANLIESELFGHEKGAFTGAIARKIGRFEMANRGTIFLDEIGDLQVELQAKLLRVLEEGEFERLGSSFTIKVDARVIAATNRNLDEALEAGEFRQDLFYRLNVFPIEVPPLRERREDIPQLVNYFVSRYSTKTNIVIESIPKEVMKGLMGYDWPGNVRELENVIERAVILSKDNTLVVESLHEEPARDDQETSSSHRMQDVERTHILSTLKECNWIIEGKRGAAQRLGLPPSTLRHRIRKLGITRSTI
jgi:PAS domain S-box-containing protein